MSKRRRRRDRKRNKRNKENGGMTAVKAALLETREGRALINEVQRYKKEVESYFSSKVSEKK